MCPDIVAEDAEKAVPLLTCISRCRSDTCQRTRPEVSMRRIAVSLSSKFEVSHVIITSDPYRAGEKRRYRRDTRSRIDIGYDIASIIQIPPDIATIEEESPDVVD